MLEQEDPSDKTNILRSVQMYLNVVLGPFLSDLSLCIFCFHPERILFFS